MDAVILINRGGGTASRDSHIGAKVEAALRDAGIAGTVELLDGAGVARRAGEAVEAGAPLVIAGGGDGSIGAAAGAIAGSDTTLGILPLGTLNHLARDLGIPFDIDAAAAIIGNGIEHRIDVAELNGRVFVNNSAVGLYPLMVVDRDAQHKRLGRSKPFAMAIAAVRAIARFRHYRITLCAEGDRLPIDTNLLFVGNNSYDFALPAAGRRAKLDDGKLSVRVLSSKGRLRLFRDVANALLGRARMADLIELDQIDQLRVESHHSHLTVSIDGEAGHFATPLIYRIRKGALKVMVPGAD